jgi:GNAT superfamily N-acetyltransferase
LSLSLVPIIKSLSKSSFDCGYPELNEYLRHYALKNDQLSIGKTFVALSDSEQVAGYLTISTAQISAQSLPETFRMKLPRYPVPAFRIGKLAVDLRFQGTGTGRWILTQALQKAVEVSQTVGLFAVLVDAIDEKAKGFYLKYGFIPFEGQPLTLFLPLATIKAAIDPVTS